MKTRIKILVILNENKHASVQDIVRKLRIPQSTVSRHLGLLKRVGLVDYERKKKLVYYFIDKKQPPLVNAILKSLKKQMSLTEISAGEIKPGSKNAETVKQ